MSDTKPAKSYIKGNPKDIFALLQRLSDDSNYRITDVTLDKDDDGDYVLHYEFAESILTVLAFHRKKANTTTFQGIRFYTIWQNNNRVDFKKINEYNRESLFGKAYLHKEGTKERVMLEIYVDISERIREEHLVSNILSWNVVAAKFFNEYLAQDDDDDDDGSDDDLISKLFS